ncbi:peptide-N-glycosidase F-related protein [Flavobacterium suzhouense]|uniref:Peptide-N-glycosidase F-related protein n=1 Tax=Flavobacterium suzhouense TaxID=1529638 RepID=A0ABW5NR25_9FLAO
MNRKITQLRNKLTKAGAFMLCLAGLQAEAQETVTVYDGVLFYDGYATFLTDAELYEPIPTDIHRFTNAKYSKKLSDEQLDAIGNTLQLNITLEAACDNYDRLGHISLAFVPKGSETYVQAEVQRIEMARIITPFMNKNVSPSNVPYTFKLDNVASILSDTALREEYDMWLEVELFGTTSAGQTQIPGCSGRKDTFRATIEFETTEDPSIIYENELFFKPVLGKVNFNNYNATDVPGETTKLINFTLDTEVQNLKLFLITSNHGANENGEEYIRRQHYVYLNNNLIYAYAPGGKSCEPYRQFNTQGNGIYNATVKPQRGWIYWNNWCPGDKIPVHEVDLGTLPAGTYTVKVDVPDAVFNAGQGNFPISAYLENRGSGNTAMCAMPYQLTGTSPASGINANWNQLGNIDEWEVLYGKIYNAQGQTTNAVLAEENYATFSGDSQGLITENLSSQEVYQIFVRSKCSEEVNSPWSLPYYRQTTVLALSQNAITPFMYYPNPVENNLFLVAGDREMSNVSVYDMNGRLVMQKELSGVDAMVNMENLTTGVYLLKVTVEGETQTYKFQKK